MQVIPSETVPVERTMSDVIDALKRLERVGSEDSKTTQKLLGATKELACALAKIIPAGVKTSTHRKLDGKIQVRPRFHGNYCVADYNFLMYPDTGGDAEYLSISPTRSAALMFSEDIANGLLEHIREEVERHTLETAKAIPALETALTSLDRAFPKPKGN